jgi:hypothetical protein
MQRYNVGTVSSKVPFQVRFEPDEYVVYAVGSILSVAGTKIVKAALRPEFTYTDGVPNPPNGYVLIEPFPIFPRIELPPINTPIPGLTIIADGQRRTIVSMFQNIALVLNKPFDPPLKNAYANDYKIVNRRVPVLSASMVGGTITANGQSHKIVDVDPTARSLKTATMFDPPLPKNTTYEITY